MNLLLESELEPLLDERPGPCISLYLFLSGIGTRALQGGIRLKNLLREARAGLQARGLDPDAIESLLDPLEELVTDLSFWNTQEDGVALFRSPGFLRVFHLPHDFAQRCVIADHFFLKPLLPLVSRGETFYVLALSQNGTRLLEATCRTVRRLHPEGLPGSLVEALGEEKTAQHLQYHTASRAPRAQVAVFHGRGTAESETKEELRRYLRQVESAVSRLLAGRTVPLVLAGAEPLPSLYREISGYPHLAAESIPGNPEPLRNEELRDRAWEILEPVRREELQRAAERFEDLSATLRASSDLMAILPAARAGRVEALLLACDADRWGRLDESEGKLQEVHATPEQGDEELLDAAARLSLRHGGKVYGVDRGELPGGGEVAAVFRY